MVIPQGLGINSSLLQIDFTNNKFPGEIPPYTCFGRKKVFLYLPLNLHHGSLPPNLRLDKDNLTCSILAFGEGSGLIYMDLSVNNINDFIPLTLGNCVNLTMINWSRNRLFGPVTREVGNLVNLHDFFSQFKYLVDPKLGRISLGGTIPSSLGTLQSLEALNLTSEGLIGEVPRQLTAEVWISLSNVRGSLTTPGDLYAQKNSG